MLSLALALICAALVVRGVFALRLAQADLARTGVEATLEGAALTAETAIIRNAGPGPFLWSFTTSAGATEVLAEPEAEKMALAAAARAPDALFAPFQIADLADLRQRASAAAAAGGAPAVGPLDAAPLWSSCAPSAFSGLGVQPNVVFQPAAAPTDVAPQPAWHIGEAWRLRLTTPTGWRDDRIVRFTGNPQHPAAVVTRTFGRVGNRGGACDQLLMALARG